MPHEPDANHVKECIQQVPVLRVLPDESFDRLQSRMRHRRLSPGEVLIRTGDSLGSLFVVADGLLTVSHTHPNGREQVVRELRPGDFYGELALFNDVESDAEVVAVVESVACILDRETVKLELQQSPAVTWNLVRALAERLEDAERVIGNLALLDVSQRLISSLLQLGRSGKETPEGVEFTIPFTWADLATRIATTPESLSRRLKQLSESGLLRFDGRRVTLLDLDGLRQLLKSP